MNIKKILVPTDFSHASTNALLYAAGLAKRFNAHIEIVHAVLIPVLTARGKLFFPDDDIVNTNLQKAEKLLKKVKKMVSTRSDLKLTTDTILINWQIELGEAIHGRNADLIVLGMTGASRFKKIFMGSTAARIVQHSPVPVLAIPANAEFSPPKKIGFAYDGLPIKAFEKLSVINFFRNEFNASIDVFQIIKNNQQSSAYLSELMQYLPDAQSNSIYDNEVESGILNTIESNNLDMMTMIPRRRGFFHNLILGSITKRVAYKITVPLLAIPE